MARLRTNCPNISAHTVAGSADKIKISRLLVVEVLVDGQQGWVKRREINVKRGVVGHVLVSTS